MSAPCWRGCGRLAEPGSLSCRECRSESRATHDAVQADKQAEYARDVNEANLRARGSRYVPCARCGAPGTVLARWARLQEREGRRRQIQSDLQEGIPLDSEAPKPLEGKDAYLVSIALSAPAGNFDPDDCCGRCTRAKYADFYNA